MKTKIYYITRSYYPYQKGGGPLMRTGAVKYLKELDWDVTVVMPNYKSKEFKIEDDIWQIPFNGKHIQKLASLFERVGIYEDYLDKWVDNAFEYLMDKITKNDVVFTTSGGELGMIKLGSLLKDTIGCKFVVNFHDPLDYSLVHGLRLDEKFHVSREKQEQKYLENSDLIVTSSVSNKQSLEEKYPKLQNKILNNYFGYIKKLDLEIVQKQASNVIKIAYVGSMSATQKPEILHEAYKSIQNKSNVEIYFIGDRKGYEPLLKINDERIKFIDYMAHEDFLEFMIKNIDVGFVCLANDYLGACVPSKIYEYINLGLPILGALPDGDGKDIVNTNNYGIASRYDDIDAIVMAMEKMADKDYLEKIKLNILRDKDTWSMKVKMKELNALLGGLSNEN